MDLQPFKQVYTLSIVIVGNFNPSIIQPFWFSSKRLIRDQEAQDAKVEVIHSELVKWSLDWMSIEATKTRLEIRSSLEQYFGTIRDLLVGMLGILKETPISAIGINHLLYFAIPDEERYFEFGNKLVPLSNWKGIISNPKMFLLDIGEDKRSDNYSGQYHVRVQPSDIKLSTPYGILIYINDHFDFERKFDGNSELIEMLNNYWDISSKRAIDASISVGNI